MNYLDLVKTDSNWIVGTWIRYGVVLNKEYFSGHKASLDLLHLRCKEFNTTLTTEQVSLIDEVSNGYIETEIVPDSEETRLLLINEKTGSIIYSKYSREKQFNISNLLFPYTELDKEDMFMFIETVRGISRNAKDIGIPYEEIDWAGLDE